MTAYPPQELLDNGSLCIKYPISSISLHDLIDEGSLLFSGGTLFPCLLGTLWHNPCFDIPSPGSGSILSGKDPFLLIPSLASPMVVNHFHISQKSLLGVLANKIDNFCNLLISPIAPASFCKAPHVYQTSMSGGIE